jgi:mRNA interferase RelE/StbE
LAWTIKYTDTARTLLRKIDKQAARGIVNYLDDRISVFEDPRQKGQALKGLFGGLWRYQVGDFPIICDIQDGALCILVVKI